MDKRSNWCRSSGDYPEDIEDNLNELKVHYKICKKFTKYLKRDYNYLF
jgi:hypothetical protein